MYLFSWLEKEKRYTLEADNVEQLHFFPNCYFYPQTDCDWLEQYIRTFLERDQFHLLHYVVLDYACSLSQKYF